MIRQGAMAFALACTTTQAMAGITWGVNGHPITAYPGIPIADQLDLVSDLGMKSYRVNVSSADQADHLDALVSAARERSLEILPVLTPGGLDLEKDSEEEIYQKTYALAHDLGKRFKNKVDVWELGNEEENYAILQPCELRDDGTEYPCEWGPAGGVDPLDYHGERWRKVSALLKGLSDGLEAAAPAALTAMGSAGWGHVGAFERLRRDGLDWDFSVWHIYGEDPEWALEILESYDRPIWITELNHPYGSKDGQAAQAEGLAAMMNRLLDLSHEYRIEAVHIYELLDETYWAPDFEADMGLASLVPAPEGWMVGPPKLAYARVRDLVRRIPPEQCPQSDERVETPNPTLQAAYAYCLLFDRTAEPSDVERWQAALASGGASPADLLASLIGTREFESLHGVSSTDSRGYVTLLYRRLLGREPDGYGLDSYAQQIDAGAISQIELAKALLASGEFLNRHPVFKQADTGHARLASARACDLDALPSHEAHGARVVAYAACLLLPQQPTAEGLAHWKRPIEDGAASPLDLSAAVFQSAAFAARHRTSEMSNAEYVTFVYNLLLRRDPDGQGLEGYVAQLEAGVLSREALGLAVMQSTEFAALHPLLKQSPTESSRSVEKTCELGSGAEGGPDTERRVGYIHCLILGVAASEDFLRHWSGLLQSQQASRGDLVVALLQSDEFAARYGPEILSDANFVTLIFQLMLGREPDGAGLQAYVGQLAAGSLKRENVALGVLGSSEFNERHAALAE